MCRSGAPTARSGLWLALPALAACAPAPAAPAAPAAAGAAGNTVTLDFYYGPACGNCLNFMRQAILPVIKSGIPGNRLKVTVLPFIRLEEKLPVAVDFWDTYCLASDVCYYALAPMCALKVAVPAAAPADSPELAKGVHFAECNQAKRLISHPDSHLQVTEEMRTTEDAESRACAAQAGMPYDGPGGIKTCVDSHEGLRLIHTPGYTDRIHVAEHLLDQSGKQQMPYIFLDGEVLRCDGSAAGVQCSAAWSTGAGEHLLPHPGSLLHVICSRLSPPPPACSGVSANTVKVGPTPKCENCADVGSFRWQRETTAPWSSAWTGAAAGVAAVVVGALAMFAWRRARNAPTREAPESQDASLLVME